MGVETQSWWNELLELRNELSVRELSQRFGASPGEISRALRQTRTHRTPQGRPEGEPVSVGSNSSRPGSKDTLLEPLRAVLGTISDADAADRVGVSMRTVAAFRRRNNIDAYQGRGAPKKRFRRSKIDAFAHLVGKLPDREVAERASVTLNAVRNYRTNRGIPSSRARAKAEREAAKIPVTEVAVSTPSISEVPSLPEVKLAPLPPTGGFAWRVRFESGMEGILTACGADEAAMLGRKHDANIVLIERIGRML